MSIQDNIPNDSQVSTSASFQLGTVAAAGTGTQLGVDYSFARPDPSAIKAAGYGFVIRYVAPSAEAEKALSAPEATALHAAGLAILLVFEDGAQNALGGSAQGTIDGKIAKAAAQALGYPTSCPIFAAVDFDAQGDQIQVIDQYFAAFAAAIAPYPGGTYGDEAVGQSESGMEYWETEAWDGTSVSGQAALYQRVKPTTANPVPGTDEDVLLKPITMWQSTAPTPQPVPTPPPLPPAPPGVVVPPFPLLAGNWFGPESSDPRNHSGFDAQDRPGIEEYQQQMKNRGWDIAVDGEFGIQTENVTRGFQHQKGLIVDGLVGPYTWHAAWALPVTPA